MEFNHRDEDVPVSPGISSPTTMPGMDSCSSREEEVGVIAALYPSPPHKRKPSMNVPSSEKKKQSKYNKYYVSNGEPSKQSFGADFTLLPAMIFTRVTVFPFVRNVRRDIRRSFPLFFAKAFNSADLKIYWDYLRKYFHRDFTFSKTTNKQYIEGAGVLNAAWAWFTRMMEFPDLAVKPLAYAVRDHRDGTSILLSRYELTGTLTFDTDTDAATQSFAQLMLQVARECEMEDHTASVVKWKQKQDMLNRQQSEGTAGGSPGDTPQTSKTANNFGGRRNIPIPPFKHADPVFRSTESIQKACTTPFCRAIELWLEEVKGKVPSTEPEKRVSASASISLSGADAHSVFHEGCGLGSGANSGTWDAEEAHGETNDVDSGRNKDLAQRLVGSSISIVSGLPVSRAKLLSSPKEVHMLIEQIMYLDENNRVTRIDRHAAPFPPACSSPPPYPVGVHPRAASI